jgi:hypothetical protein
VVGNRINYTDMVMQCGKMDENIKDIMLMVKNKEMEHIHIQMVNNILENGCQVFNMDMVRYIIQMVK